MRRTRYCMIVEDRDGAGVSHEIYFFTRPENDLRLTEQKSCYGDYMLVHIQTGKPPYKDRHITREVFKQLGDGENTHERRIVWLEPVPRGKSFAEVLEKFDKQLVKP